MIFLLFGEMRNVWLGGCCLILNLLDGNFCFLFERNIVGVFDLNVVLMNLFMVVL